MNSSELLRLQLSKNLECSRIGYASGPTGPTGPIGDTGPRGPDGYPKVYTFFLDFVAGGTRGGILSRIYIPPGFSTDPRIANGGIFTADIPGLLIFFGLNTINIFSTTYNFPVGITGSGYNVGGWVTTSGGSIGTATGIQWKNIANATSITTLNTISLINIGPQALNGGTTTPKYLYIPGTIIPDNIGWLATLTLYYL